MRRLVYIFVTMLAAGAVSCHRTSVTEERLIAIDSLIATAPDSALILLQAISPSENSENSENSEISENSPSKIDQWCKPNAKQDCLNFAEAKPIDAERAVPEGRGSMNDGKEAKPHDRIIYNDELHAYHALLTAQAMYKAYIPATSDSIINIAWDYYKDCGIFSGPASRRRRIRAMLYKGTTAEETGNLDSAMYWYKRTELESRPDDHYHRGFALMNMGILYQQSYSYKHAINKYRQVLDESKHIDIKIKKFCLLQLNKLYIINDLDSTYYYLNQLKHLVDSIPTDSYYKNSYYENLVFYYYYKNDYDSAKKTGDYIINNDSVSITCACWQAVSISYAKLGNRDSALYYHNHSPLPVNIDDSVWFNQSESEIRLLDGDFRSSVKYENVADELAGAKVITAIDNSLVTIESKAEKDWNNSQHRHSNAVNLMLVSIVAVIAILIILFIHWHTSRKKKTEILSLQKFVEQLEYQASESKKNYSEQIESRNVEIETMQQSIEHFANTLRTLLNSLQKPSKKTSKTDSKQILKEVLSVPFFSFLRQYVDNAHHGLVTKMSVNNKISEQDINIICMHICKIPNTIIATYSGYTSVHSVTTRKERIIRAFLGKDAQISDIMNY